MTQGGSFFPSVEEYVDARGGNRAIKKVRLPIAPITVVL